MQRLSPRVVIDGTSVRYAAFNVFDRLVEYKPGSTTIIPGLAERWSISPDGLEYIFHLRKNTPFLSCMALYHMSVTSREYWEKLLALKHPELFDSKPKAPAFKLPLHRIGWQSENL